MSRKLQVLISKISTLDCSSFFDNNLNGYIDDIVSSAACPAFLSESTSWDFKAGHWLEE